MTPRRMNRSEYEHALQLVLKRDGWRCYICKRTTRPRGRGEARRLTLDHVVPLSQGGSNDPENLRVACKRCNQQKADAMPEAYWWRLMQTLLRWELCVPRRRWL